MQGTVSRLRLTYHGNLLQISLECWYRTAWIQSRLQRSTLGSPRADPVQSSVACVVDCEQPLILAIAIVALGRAKGESTPARPRAKSDATLPSRCVSPKFRTRVCVFSPAPRSLFTKIRDYSQSTCIARRSRELTERNRPREDSSIERLAKSSENTRSSLLSRGRMTRV